jgi:membrane-associated phospholipid phosphatase
MAAQRTPQPRDNDAVSHAGTRPGNGARVPEPGQPETTMLPAHVLLLAAGLLVALFVVLTAVVATGGVLAWEHDVVEAAVDAPAAIGLPSRAIMELGTRGALPAIALVVYLLTSRWQPAVAVLGAGAAAAVLTGVTKLLIGRERPSGLDVRYTADGSGFPSGHTTIAFSVAAILALHVGSRRGWKMALVPFGLAAIVGFARLYVGVHYPTDVVGGALAGVAGGSAVGAISVFRPTGRRM